MDEQQMQFVDPEWQPPDYNRPGVINLDPRERPSPLQPTVIPAIHSPEASI